MGGLLAISNQYCESHDAQLLVNNLHCLVDHLVDFPQIFEARGSHRLCNTPRIINQNRGKRANGGGTRKCCIVRSHNLQCVVMYAPNNMLA
jgi:hypothetical protein